MTWTLARAVRSLAASCIALLGLAVLAVPAAAASGPMVNVTCTSPVAYGGEIDCTAASVTPDGNFGVAGTFTFDPGHVLPVVWDASTCSVNQSSCQVAGTVAVVPDATVQTLDFDVRFAAADSGTSTTTESVSLTLVPTITTLACDADDVAQAGSTHCLVSVVDQFYDGAPTTPAQLPATVTGLAVTSSDPGDTITYDRPSTHGTTCVAAVAGGALECGLTVSLDAVRGLHTLSVGYPGNPATDELSSSATAVLSDGPRATPTVTVGCPASVPARQPQVTCQVAVAGAAGVTPTGTVTLDQSLGDVPAGSPSCTLAAGTCTIAYEVFEGTVQVPPPPVRAAYSGDDNYLPAAAAEPVAVIATPTTSRLSCEVTSVPVGSSAHCTFVLSGPDGKPVPVGPTDSITISTTTGSVVCDVPAPQGCGHTDTDDATVVGFTLNVGGSAGPLLVTGEYSGDVINEVAGASQGLPLTTIPVSGAAPPVIGLGRAMTRTTVRCASSVAYLHPVSCLVTVAASGTVPTGTVRVTAPASGHQPLITQTCRLSSKGRCTISLVPALTPSAHLRLEASYLGAAGFQGSAAQAAVLVRTVSTATVIRCAHKTATSGEVVHCTATVRTEFGATPGSPARTHSEVTVTGHGDRITYDHGRACRWVVTRQGLTCGFSVSVARSTTVHVYYRGSSKAKDATSKGTTTIKATRAS